MSPVRIDNAVTSGLFTLDGGSWEVDNNVWIVGDDTEVVVVDAPHDAETILDMVGDRRVVAIVCTHGHDDHIDAALELAAHTDAPVLIHPSDHMLWKRTHPDLEPDGELWDGQAIAVAGIELSVLHTPGHTPGAVSLYAPALASVFSGDTLFNGGPGATGRSYSDFPTIIDSIRDRLLTLPAETTVLPGHGDSTTIGDEAPNLDGWIARGH